MSTTQETNRSPIRALISDLTGTLVDFGCMVPAKALVELFQRNGIAVPGSLVREYMGMKRREHIKALLSVPHVWEQWNAKHGAPPSEQDTVRLYEEFIPLQIEHFKDNGILIPGVLHAASQIENMGIALAVTTGCNAETMNLILDKAREQGFVPGCAVSSAQVATGRPAPWMIYRAMELLDVFPGTAVVKVGDTLADIAAGRNAGVWSVGIVATGNMMGLSQDDYDRLNPSERNARLKAGRKAMADAGAHYVIDSFAQVPSLLATVKLRIEAETNKRSPD